MSPAVESDRMDVVEHRLEKLGLALDEDQLDEASVVGRTLSEAIRIDAVDPLSVDLPQATAHMVSQFRAHSVTVLSEAQPIIDWLTRWAAAPRRETVGEALNRISALLLVEGLGRASLEALTDAGRPAEWTDGRFTAVVGAVFRPILVELVARWILPEAPATVFHHLALHARGERVHVCVAYATGCLMPTAPQIRGLVMAYFERNPSVGIVEQALAASDGEEAAHALLVACRLLRQVPGMGRGWEAPLTGLMSSGSSSLVRLLACESLSLAKGLSDLGRAQLLETLQIDEALVGRVLAWLVHGESQYEQASLRLMMEQNQRNIERGLWQIAPGGRRDWMSDRALSSCVANVGGVLLYADAAVAATDGGGELVQTPKVRQNIHAMALATSRSEPVLLQGRVGSGKTALVEWLARRTGNELVTIHLNSNMDAKVLLGNYVTTQRAGDFEWRAGLLTTAVSEGRWVLIENIDLAPSDVIQTLVPLIESHTLFVASRGESITAHIQFRLFATLSIHGRSPVRTDGLLGSSIWTRLEIGSLDAELPQIIAGVYPGLVDNAEFLARAFGSIQGLVSSGPASSRSQVLSTRDLIKWCTRLNKHGADDALQMFQEAVDTFTMREADYAQWRALVLRVGAVFGIGQVRAEQFVDQHSPEVTVAGQSLIIGRATLDKDSAGTSDRMPFADTRHARCLLERLATCVQLGEPALLLGETGGGKTTLIQHLATLAGRPLAVFNLSQQSDSSDLLGGFRPVDISLVALRLREAFDAVFGRTVSVRKNAAFLDRVRVAYGKKDWRRLAGLYRAALGNARKMLATAHRALGEGGEPQKRQKLTAASVSELSAEWDGFERGLEDFEATKGARMVFRFVEGALVRAARAGEWILLDEINLASAETLACLGGLLQRERSLLLAETGTRVACHPAFRLFACMNPSTDVGKRDLPPALRSGFTEMFVHPPDANNDDLLAIVRTHLPRNAPPMLGHRIIDFYRSAKRLAAEHRLVDGANQRPHYSLRTLTRSLTYARDNAQAYSLRRALYDGLCMTFVTQLEGTTQAVLVRELHAVFDGDNIRQMLRKTPPARSSGSVLVQGFWLPAMDAGDGAADEDDGGYVVTASVEAKITSLARAVMCGRYPVLIQGPTSAGKTSMVQHLARKTGHKFVRINNHEHTDLQEYLGAYSSVDGRLVFEEGLLVKALRHGHWLVLDELNLAPSDVLEALNRLLDDNRELVIPETQEVVRPHPHFMLFATQNPAGLYGGRKALSRAFRNRFVELHFDEIPEPELQQIIIDSCQVPPSHAALLVDVYRNLTQVRAQTRIFEASHGFITLRDLFRWAQRRALTRDELAEHGFMLLAERVRSHDEKQVVRQAIERAFYGKPTGENARARRGIDVDGLYSEHRLHEMDEFRRLQEHGTHIAWTKAMRRLFILTALCLRYNEPVLLVGETGAAKTTVCQMLAAAASKQLHIVNCHQNTESSDILGGQRPIRNRAALLMSARSLLVPILGSEEQAAKVDTPAALTQLMEQWQADDPQAAQAAIDAHREQLANAHEQLARAQDLFAWHDGPLVQALKQGDMFLMDELNLADDSVLERLNSVLEPSRSLVLAEHVGAATLTARDGFEFVATMNPGGDYGKRELSPALRNRFTELWAPTTTDPDDLRMIIVGRLRGVEEVDLCARVILSFVAYLRDELKILQHPLSLRDYLFWADFISRTRQLMDVRSCLVHGACLVLLDSIGTQGSSLSISMRSPSAVKAACVSRLREMVGWVDGAPGVFELGVVPSRDTGIALAAAVVSRDDSVGVEPFLVKAGSRKDSRAAAGFALEAPTTFDNLVKILRAMQVGKPLLLEGSPGVGKTTLVDTLARIAGHRLVRVNLSDQTDLMDLFGTDLPVDDGFAWCDAPFLQALKRGDWVLLDEINLASQSVLEGLNSCLDHRGTVYISELDREFSLSPGFRLFAAQNPLGQGGGRKGLPRSFVNRFTQVFMDELCRDDLQTICDGLYGAHPSISRVLEFNWRMHHATMVRRAFGASGAPWEFNLRDVSRFMLLALSQSSLEAGPKPVDEFIAMLYIQRMRTQADREAVLDLYRDVFGQRLQLAAPSVHMTQSLLQVGNAVLPRQPAEARPTRLRILHAQLPYLESLMKCLEMRWMAILVGAAGIGKTSLVRWLANATGNKLVEFSMNSGVDTSEILGGFEQVDMQRHRSALLHTLGRLVHAMIQGCSFQSADAQRVSQACALFETAQQPKCATSELQSIVGQIIAAADGQYRALADDARRAVDAFAALEVAGRFEWVDGVLVDALLNGHWLLLDRANLCSASVLDRLNGLLEPNGVLYVNEDPKRTGPIVPHANFRIIMAVDPQYGELSRAMRNRGIEICMLPPADDECRASDQLRIARAMGVSPSLLSREVTPAPSLAELVQGAMHIAERTQRGYLAHIEGEGPLVDVLAKMLAQQLGPLDSAADTACWQARLVAHATSSDSGSHHAERGSRWQIRMVLAAISTLPPESAAASTRVFRAIVRDKLLGRMLDSELVGSIVAARKMMAQACGVNAELLADAPVYMLLNYSLCRAVERHGADAGPLVRWHAALLDTLQFYQERVASESYYPPDDTARELVLQRPNVDVVHVQSAFDLVDDCDRIIASWESLVASADDSEAARSVAGVPVDLMAMAPLLRALYAMKGRLQKLLAQEHGSASEEAVALENTQDVLTTIAAAAPATIGKAAATMLETVHGLILDATHSARIWTLTHPTTLPDEQSHGIETRLTASISALDDVQMRNAAVEALAMLYAAEGRKNKDRIVAAVHKFVQTLPVDLPSEARASAVAVSPAAIVADVNELNAWYRVMRLVGLAGGMPRGSKLRARFVGELRNAVRAISIDQCSPWALLLTRVSWAANEGDSATSTNLLSLFTDITYMWHVRLSDNRDFDPAIDTPAQRLYRAVGTELVWKRAGLIDCPLGEYDRVSKECGDLLRSLAVHHPAPPLASEQLAGLVALAGLAVRAVDGSYSQAFSESTEELIAALHGAEDTVDRALVDRWLGELKRATEPVAGVVAPAASALKTALVRPTMELVCVAMVEVGLCLLRISVPQRPVDPAAKAHVQWAWLGQDIADNQASVEAYQAVQRSMTGEADTAATQPLMRRVTEIEGQQAEIELVYRPSGAVAFAELWHEAHSLCKGVLGRARDVCSELMSDALSAESFARAQGAAATLQATLAQFEIRVRGRYFGAFRDQAQIWCSYVRQIAHGLGRLVELRRVAVGGPMREHAETVAGLYRQPVGQVPATRESNTKLKAALGQLKTMVFFTAGASPLRAYGNLLVTLLMRVTLGTQVRGVLGPAELEALDIVFSNAYDVHKRAADERRRREAEASKLFRAKFTEEQTDEQLLNEIFPGYEDVYEAEEAEDLATDKQAEPSFQDIPEDTVAAISACHQYLMLQFGVLEPCGDVQPGLVAAAQRQAFQMAASLLQLRPDLATLQPSSADSLLRGANLLSLAAVLQGSSAGKAEQHPLRGVRYVHVYDFYKDTAPGEAGRLREVAGAIAERAQQLMDEWPDHAVLEQIRDMARRLLQLPVTSPTAKLLAGLEQLYMRAQDWEQFAAADVKIQALVRGADLIKQWRQAELNAWPHLLQAQELEFARRPNEWWFNLYASLVEPVQTTLADLVAAVDQFMQASPAGEFRGRLNMLHAFAAHRGAVLAAQARQEGASLTAAKQADSVYGPLTNAIAYYLQYAPCIAEQLERAKRGVGKDLAQYVKISSWKDTTPEALRAGAQKTHKHLTKCVRRWREALSQPIFQIIQVMQASSIATARVPQVSIVPLPLGNAGFDIVHAASTGLAAATSLPWAAAAGLLTVDAAVVADLATHTTVPGMSKVLASSATTIGQLGRFMAAAVEFGRVTSQEGASGALEEWGQQLVGDIHYFQNMETPKRLTKPPAKADTAATAPKKLIIKSKKQKAEEAEQYVDDDDERQRLIRQFWGEQRNLRRTRLKEILKGLQEIGLKRHFRAIQAEPEEADQKKGTAALGLTSVLRQAPLDVAAWHDAVSVVAALGTESVHVRTVQAQRSWRQADAAFFRLSAQLAQLKAAMYEEHSEEVSAQQIQHISGLMESLGHNITRDRKHAAELLASATAWMQAAAPWAAEAFGSDAGSTVASLKQAVDELKAQLEQFFVSARRISDAGGWGAQTDAVAGVVVSLMAASSPVTQAQTQLVAVQAGVTAAEFSGLAAHDAAAAMPVPADCALAVREAAGSLADELASVTAGVQLSAGLLDPWLQPITECTDRVVALAGSSTEALAVEANSQDTQWLAEAAGLVGQWATAVMNVWQAVAAAEQQFAGASGEQNMWGLEPKELVRRLEMTQQFARALHVPTMVGLCHSLTRLTGTSGQSEVRQRVGTRVVRPWIAQYSLMVQHVVAVYADAHCVAVQFALTTATALTSVVVHGLGSNDVFDSEETDESMQNGTGMGEGSTAGAKNVSDEIEGEDQVEGVQGEDPDESNEPDTNEDAVDMEGDFQGQLGDADLQTDDEDSDKDSSDDEDDEPDVDEQMGDVDPTDPTALDDKLWDDEEKDQKKDEDSKVDGSAQQQKDETDIVAGEENDDDEGKGDENDPDKTGEQGDDDDKMSEDGSGSDSDGESDDGADLDDAVNQDTLDRMADVEEQGDQMDMPEDLDMGDVDDEEEGDGSDEDDGLEADMNDLPEDEPIEQRPDGLDEEDVTQDAEQNPDAMDEDNAPEGAAAGQDGEVSGSEDEGSGSEDAGSDAEDEGSDQEADGSDLEGEVSDREDAVPEDDERENSGADKPIQGVDTAMNMDGSDETDPNTAAESKDAVAEPSDAAATGDSSEQQQQQSAAQSAAAPQEGRQEPSEQQGQEQEQQKLSPERTLADVIEKWERRLNMAMREEPGEKDSDEKDSDEKSPDEKSPDEPPAENAEFEHVAADQDFDPLADAEEHERDQQDTHAMDIDEDEDEDEDDELAPQPQRDAAGDDAQAPDDEKLGDQDQSAAAQEPQMSNPHLMQNPDQARSSERPADAAQMEQSGAGDVDDAVEMGGQDSESEGEPLDHEPEDEEEAAVVDAEQLRLDLEAATAAWRESSADSERAAELWQAYSRLTHELALALSEQLRLVLAPTQATQLRGDYRTGKRLNMKRIIPYIASEFRKDKIWLRRTKPARREYQVMVALDNSRSMAQSPRAVELAYETLALITTALSRLEVGQLSVVSFGEHVRLLHPFDAPFDDSAGARVLQRLTFADERTDVAQLMDAALALYAAAEVGADADLWRLQLVISDGVCQDHPRLLRQVRAAFEQRIMAVFVVLDRAAAAADGSSEGHSIMDTQHVSFVRDASGKSQMRVQRYLDTFPFKYYVVLRDIHGLPTVLAETLRQYFALVGSD
ncbi:AAA ATPase midasin [Coemansia sp. RSA 552]|nr:AAA ATPase midasin [Coemansia sp. RSA 552]